MWVIFNNSEIAVVHQTFRLASDDSDLGFTIPNGDVTAVNLNI